MFDRNHDRTNIEDRKNQQMVIALNRDVEYTFPDASFDGYLLEHCALPELSLSEIDTSVKFLGKTVSMPLLISPMIGGTSNTFSILNTLAEVAQEKKLVMGVGSQRIALEHLNGDNYFRIRNIAPEIPLLANLGAVQLNYGLAVSDCQRAVDILEADALVLHLNPLHECLQNEGNSDFRNLLSKIEAVIKAISVPVIVKEVGFGISLHVAQQLADIGVYAIDLAGAGGTSWALIESERALTEEAKDIGRSFVSWGIPTARLLEEFAINRHLVKAPIIASGGIRSGIEIAKSIAMGASIAGIGLPLLRDASQGCHALMASVDRLKKELAIAMLCTGSQNIQALGNVRVIPYDNNKSLAKM